MVSGEARCFLGISSELRTFETYCTLAILYCLLISVATTPSEDCVYKDLEFLGDNLKVVPTQQFDECKAACEEFPACTFFTVTSLVCVLKEDDVSIKQKPGAVSGMTTAACGKATEDSYKKRF